jgi:predicted transcriptional regulator
MAQVRTLRIGIAPYEQIKARTLAIARGQHRPSPDEPKVWFTSIESLAQVLSTNNKLLLQLIARTNPASVSKLAELSGRHKGNLSRTLKTMERYGLVSLTKDAHGHVVPRVAYERLSLDVDLAS